MRILLDTHILLWWLGDDAALPDPAAGGIADASSEVIVSAASAWEITVKTAAGRLEAPDDLLDALAENRFDILDITAGHAVGAGQLPAHHSDPFDPMLNAQARMGGLPLVSVDPRFADYDVELLPLR